MGVDLCSGSGDIIWRYPKRDGALRKRSVVCSDCGAAIDRKHWLWSRYEIALPDHVSGTDAFNGEPVVFDECFSRRPKPIAFKRLLDGRSAYLYPEYPELQRGFKSFTFPMVRSPFPTIPPFERFEFEILQSESG